MADAPTLARMADWLDLHQIRADEIRTLLDHGLVAPLSAPVPDPPDPGPKAHAARVHARLESVWDASLPDGLAGRMTLWLRPLSVLGQRAATVEDGGNGMPLVLCPPRGGMLDLIRLAHEIGHAAQLVASHPRRPPPILREACAILAEHLVMADPGLTPAEARAARAAHDRLAEIDLRRSLPNLRAALDDPARPYDADWNYPPARIIAQALADAGPAAARPLVEGRTSLRDLIRALF